jgi:hypothetical protein
MNADQLTGYLKEFYPLLTDLIGTESSDIRSVLRSVFVRIGRLKKLNE